MPNRQDIIDDLIVKHLQERLTVDEQVQLDQWLSISTENKLLFERLTDQQYVSGELEKLYAFDEEKGWNNLKQQFPFEEERKPSPSTKLRMFGWRRIAVAASVLLAVGLGSYFMFFNKTTKQEEFVATTGPIDIIAPKANRAMITLSNGQQVYLDSAVNGKLLQQNGVEIVKLADGKIIYKGSADEVEYNTLSNPRGSRVIDITLGDGSQVWLNAGSSITYPVAFIGNERKVSLTGEAYFEVTHNSAMPFKVSKGKVEIVVLGTHFNVNTYDDEDDIKVTLLEGSVSVSNGIRNSLLKPGEQAKINSDVNIVSGVDIGEVMAWKEGYFKFSRANIKTIMRQLARWYDLDVQFEGQITEREFGGEMERSLPLSGMLRLLEKGNVHFRVEGKKIVVIP